MINTLHFWRMLLFAYLIAFVSLDLIQVCQALLGLPKLMSASSSSTNDPFVQYLDKLRQQDTCGTIYTSKVHGYDVREYKIITKDNYELHVHRLIHPEDYLPGPNGMPPKKIKKKPYLLVHGLIGTSASYVTNIDEHYRAPPTTFSTWKSVHDVLESKRQDYQHEWQSTAQYLQKSSIHETVDPYSSRDKKFAQLNELDYDGDTLNFAREYRQAYRKYELPKDSFGFTTNSLAFTLSNFGYDVWLVNLRGNSYSKSYNGPLSSQHAEYWDFNIETIFKEDLIATITFIMKEVDCTDPIGLVTYSYSSIHVMGLLTKFPKYQDMLQPIVMLAPTMLAATQERGKFKYFMKLADAIVSKNGPFPSLGRLESGEQHRGIANLLSTKKLDAKLEQIACSLPIASKLCRLLETIIHGGTKQVATVRGLLSSNDALLKRDTDCGQTSKAILHQIIQNLSQQNIDSNYMPYVAARVRLMRRQKLRRNIILIHSDSDEISTPQEVQRIRDTALKALTLVDYAIKEPNFSHTDYLFSQRNQYLVNAEVARMAILYDFLLYRAHANQPSAAPQGF